MENVFADLPSYGEKWNKVAERKFNEEEIKAVRNATVVNSNYGLSVCFAMLSGGQKFIPVSKMGNRPNVGDNVNLAEAKLVTLERSGDGRILKVEL